MAQARICPICKRPVVPGEEARRRHPFCSKRCADVDLARWLSGVYAIPAGPTDDADESEIPDAEAESDAESKREVRH